MGTFTYPKEDTGLDSDLEVQDKFISDPPYECWHPSHEGTPATDYLDCIDHVVADYGVGAA